MGRQRLEPVSPRALSVWAIVGLVVGWLLHPVAVAINGYAPVVTWLQPGILGFVALIVAATAWITHRQRKDGVRIEPLRAVNRFVLGRACAMVGALLAGGYGGYLVSWLGYESNPAITHRIVTSAVAAAAGLAVCVAGIVLERVCRIRDDDDTHAPTGGVPA